MQRAPLPAAVDELLDPAVARDEVLPLWREFRACYPSEPAAIAAAQRNEAPLLPFLNTAEDIGFCFQILNDKVDEAEARKWLERMPRCAGQDCNEAAREEARQWLSAHPQ